MPDSPAVAPGGRGSTGSGVFLSGRRGGWSWSAVCEALQPVIAVMIWMAQGQVAPSRSRWVPSGGRGR
jgi:hypothetical protein